MYVTIKYIHITAAGLSLMLFCLRGGLVLSAAARAEHMLLHWSLRILPHGIDTLLLASAIYLAIAIRQAPLMHGWLTAKFLALVLYIILGSLALKRAPTRPLKLAAFVAALLTFTYIVGVARTKDVWSWLALA